MHVPYAELFCRSNYSFLEGASHPEELVRRAVELGYRALAITDECSVAGVVRAHVARKDLGAAGDSLQLLIGAHFVVDGHTLVLIARSRRGYGDLCAFITQARRRCEKGHYRVELGDLTTLAHCLAIAVPAAEVGTGAETAASFHQLLDACAHLTLAIGFSRRLANSDADRFVRAAAIAADASERTGKYVPVVAVGDILHHDKARQPLQDLLRATRLRDTVTNLGHQLEPNAERTLRPLNALFHLYPYELLAHTVMCAAGCVFSLDELRYEYPEEIVPAGHTLVSYLREQTYEGARRRYGDTVPPAALALIEKELALIAELKFEAYFLTVYDVVLFARSRGILCQGRGSAANSAVCYCLGITEVDPARMSMLFERFVSKERHEPPDIDVDFEHQRREEVMQYLFQKYGRDRAALCASVTTYRAKGAVRDVGRALGFSPDQLDRISRNLGWWDAGGDMATRLAEIGLSPDSQQVQHLIRYVNELRGFPRHLSQHPCGFVIARDRLDRLVPIENAAMPDRTVIQWDKDDIDALGLMKVDVLALGMLSCIRRALDLVSAIEGRGPDAPFRLQDIPSEDPATYDMLCRGESTGVFQVESRAQMNMLPRLRPRNYFDLVIEVAIVRPGPIQGGMVHPYLRRRQGIEAATYPSPAVEGVLKRTLGVPIFQEQVMQLAMVAAGFSPGEADQLRRAMAAWKRRGGLGHLKDKLIHGMLERGYTAEFADSIYKQIAGFGTYGFPESHAASFALLVYASSWLKCHHPAAFCTALLNSQPMGFYSPSQLIQDVQRNGVTVLPIDVLQSTWETYLVPVATPTAADSIPDAPLARSPQPMMRLGLQLVSGLSEAAGRRIDQARALRQFHTLRDLAARAELNARELQLLANADALRGLTGDRLTSLWNAGLASVPDLPLAPSHDTPTAINLVPLSMGQEVLADFAATGLTLRAHPVSLIRGDLNERFRAARADELRQIRSGRTIKVAGLVTCRQRPGTASGVTFVTLEDETGNTNVVVWRDVAELFRMALLSSRLLVVTGRLEHQGPITHLIAAEMEDSSGLLGELAVASREFH